MSDQYETYQYDAEGRVKSSTCISGCGSQYVTYNALGQRVQDYQSDYLGGYMTLTYPRDIFGDRTGIWDDRPSQNWLGWDIFWARVAGQRLNMGGASAYIDHADAVGSTTMETDPSGAVDWDVVNGPWGQVWQQTGTRQSEVFAGMDWQVNDPLMPSATREYSDGLGRWMTPDPGGVKVVRLDNPQTWNMYAYAGDNPTSRNDPTGLCFDPTSCSLELAGIGSLIEPGGGTAVGAVVGGVLGAGILYFGARAIDNRIQATNSLAKRAQESSAKQGMENSGPKAENAPGVTAGGQATDEYGNKLGPSGDTQVNETQSKTREAARNRALKEGPGAVEHATPKHGQPHFHPTRRNGKKKPCSTHHNYPCR